MLNNVKELNKGLRMQIDDGKIFFPLNSEVSWTERKSQRNILRTFLPSHKVSTDLFFLFSELIINWSSCTIRFPLFVSKNIANVRFIPQRRCQTNCSHGESWILNLKADSGKYKFYTWNLHQEFPRILSIFSNNNLLRLLMAVLYYLIVRNICF